MKKNIFFLIGFLISFVSSSYFGIGILQARENNATSAEEKTRITSLVKLTKVLSTVENYYVDKLSFSQLIDKTIAGLMSNLDAHSSFMNKKEFEETKIQTNGEFGGLGIVVGLKDGVLTIVSAIDNTPAYKAGLKTNDIILKIDNNVTLGMNINDAVDKMRGKPGTKVKLMIVRKGLKKPFDVELTREIIKAKSVYPKMIENENILYLRVSNFDKNVKDGVLKAIKDNKKVNGIILDLRNNPGGLLDQAIELTNLFINKGVIVSQKGRVKAEDIVYKANPKLKITDLPLVVLINEGSASASEIVSGALQDHKRAVLVGEKSFGKGSVQVILPIGNDEGLRLTVARYYLPNGRSIQAVGITPDLIVARTKVPINKEEGISLKESDLKQHLEAELAKVEHKKNTKNKNKLEILTTNQVLNDNQLKVGIDTIKILNIKKATR